MGLGVGFYIAIVILFFVIGLYQGINDYVVGYRWYIQYRDTLMGNNNTQDPAFTNVYIYDKLNDVNTHKFAIHRSFIDLETAQREWVLQWLVRDGVLSTLTRKHLIVAC